MDTWMSEWQPIETAPKDGTAVLTYSGEPDAHEMNVSFWGRQNGRWISANPHMSTPTHWMHLPSPPHPDRLPITMVPVVDPDKL